MKEFYLTALASLLGSIALVMYLIPKIRYIVETRKLTDHPDKRSSHKLSTPTMAGVSFFLTLVLSLHLLKAWDIDQVGTNVVAAITIIFALGLKDDLIVSTPKAKIGGEILAIFFILFCNGLHIASLDGFLGIYDLPSWVVYGFMTLLILTIINSYNLIDGIDGLASTVGIVIFSVFGFIFLLAGFHFYFLFCLCLIGTQLGYLHFNLSETNKIFMGDTGSLIIGFCIGLLTLKFLSLDVQQSMALSFMPENKLIIVASILFVPLFDTARVFGIRLLQRKNPFSPDKNHIHHILISSGLSHLKASLFLGSLSLVLAIVFIMLSRYLNSFQMIWVFIAFNVFLLVLFDRLKRNVGAKNRFGYVIRAIQFLF